MEDSFREENQQISPHELIAKASTYDELILAVRKIGSLKSFNRELGLRDSGYWIRQLLQLQEDFKVSGASVRSEYLTRRYGLRQRALELLTMRAKRSGGNSSEVIGE